MRISTEVNNFKSKNHSMLLTGYLLSKVLNIKIHPPTLPILLVPGENFHFIKEMASPAINVTFNVTEGNGNR